MSVLWIGLPISEFDVPNDLRPYVEATAAGVRVVGDRAAGRDVYLWTQPERCAVSLDLAELLEAVTERGGDLHVSDFGISALLHNALVPIPQTAFANVWLLSAGDSVDLSPADGQIDVTYDFDYPWMEQKSMGDREPSEARLLELLTKGTERQLAEVGNEGFLMLSSGLDSPSVALALAEAGLNQVRCVTYRWGPEDPEPPVAASFARRLGLDHEVVDLPDDRRVMRDLLTRFFERAPLPGTDQSQIPYAAAVAAVADAQGAVLDGGGNDSYMSHFPSAHSRRKFRLRIPIDVVGRSIRRVAPVESPFNYITRSRAEATFPGRNLRQRHVDRLYGRSADMAGWWDGLSRDTSEMDHDDLFDVVLRRNIHPAQILLKQKLAATARGLDARLPWCDHDVADYYFNLPSEAKFDKASLTQKILLRRMLEMYLDYDAEAIGKHFFVFDGAAFLTRHQDFVREEIDASPLWEADGVRMVHRWIDQLDRRPLLWHAVLNVFMISGWGNHYPPAVAAIARA